jgi:hypothetical protein
VRQRKLRGHREAREGRGAGSKSVRHAKPSSMYGGNLIAARQTA